MNKPSCDMQAKSSQPRNNKNNRNYFNNSHTSHLPCVHVHPVCYWDLLTFTSILLGTLICGPPNCICRSEGSPYRKNRITTIAKTTSPIIIPIGPPELSELLEDGGLFIIVVIFVSPPFDFAQGL